MLCFFVLFMAIATWQVIFFPFSPYCIQFFGVRLVVTYCRDVSLRTSEIIYLKYLAKLHSILIWKNIMTKGR